jgi:uncharacterized protein (UPF0335 family)
MTLHFDGQTIGPFTSADLESATRKLGKPSFKPDPDFLQHNQRALDVTADDLRQFIERYEQLQAEKQDVADQQKDLMGEAKGRGYDTRVMRKIIALRKLKPDERAEQAAILDMYMSALGMT